MTRTRQGYINAGYSDHPLLFGKRHGTLGVHRAVLYEKIGPGEHACHWCGQRVIWAPTHRSLPDGLHRLIADHLDGKRSNNAPSNLVPACNPCNTLRPTPMRGRRRAPRVLRGQTTGPYDIPAPLPSTRGPARKVVGRIRYPTGDHRRSFRLECGHTVTRNADPGSELVYCEFCGRRPGPSLTQARFAARMATRRMHGQPWFVGVEVVPDDEETFAIVVSASRPLKMSPRAWGVKITSKVVGAP